MTVNITGTTIVRARSLPSLCMLAGAALLCGCQAVPGLRVNPGSEGEHPYAETAQPVGAKSGAKAQTYRVVSVTPEVVADLLQVRELARIEASNELPAIQPSDVPPEYKVGPGDILFVTVWDHPELTNPFAGFQTNLIAEGRLIAADGTMYYPYVGPFQAAGMTAANIREYLTDHLKKSLNNPKLDVRVLSYRANRIQVTGEVKNPGTVTLDDMPKGVLEAISASGGLTVDAGHRAILLRDGKPYGIDLVGLLSGDVPGRNPRLEPGDELRIPNKQLDKIYVLGEVDTQRPITLENGTMPLVEALATSGGLARRSASDSGVLVFRLNPVGSDNVATVYALDMSNPRGLLLANQFPLESRDIVYVKATAFAQYNLIIEQLMPTVELVYDSARTNYDIRASDPNFRR